ncbi:hypothetical protein RR48_04907 [Papilio machaon]|uniref:Uncharacterized protein n=1 Tax=Papilio machaon TaxID=76193 RepID=A0A0N0PEQ4_PAPMA|nr:hypothetical protein RR48_04907 [Papilio machaon]
MIHNNAPYANNKYVVEECGPHGGGALGLGPAPRTGAAPPASPGTASAKTFCTKHYITYNFQCPTKIQTFLATVTLCTVWRIDKRKHFLKSYRHIL